MGFKPDLMPRRAHSPSAPAPFVVLWLLAITLLFPPVGASAQSGAADGVIAGRVVTRDSGTPVTQGWVVATPMVQSAGPSHSYGGRIQSDGSFRIHNLALGRYLLNARAPGFLSTEQSGEPHERRTVELLATGARLVRGGAIEVRLIRTGVIAGTVRDEDGFPVERANIAVLAVTPDASRGRRNASGAGTNTDDQGQFRLGGLSAGHYLVRAQRQHSSYMMNVEDRSNPDAPASRGAHLASAYHPSGLGVDEAVVVSIAAGEERYGVDIVFPSVQAYPISGVVRNPDGTMASQLGVSILRASRRDPWPSDSNHARVREDGRFESQPLPPGEYILSANRPVPATTPPQVLFAQTTVNLGGGPAQGVVLQLQEPIRVSGTITMPAIPPPTTSVGQAGRVFERIQGPGIRPVSLTLSPNVADGSPVLPFQSGAQAPVSKSGPFTMQQLRPGTYRFGVHGSPSGWYVSEASLAGQDLLQGAATIEAGAADVAMRVALRDGGATIKGSVKVPDEVEGTVCLLHLYPAQDRSGSNPNLRQAHCSPNGDFQIASVAPGPHKLFLFTNQEFEYGDLDALAQQRWDSAPTLTARQGETLEFNPDWP